MIECQERTSEELERSYFPTEPVVIETSTSLESLEIVSKGGIPVVIKNCSALRHLLLKPVKELHIDNCPNIKTLIIDTLNKAQSKIDIKGELSLEKL